MNPRLESLIKTVLADVAINKSDTDTSDQFASLKSAARDLNDYLAQAKAADTRDHAMGYLSHAKKAYGRVLKELNELSAMSRHGAPSARSNLGGRVQPEGRQPIRFDPPDLATAVGGDLKADGKFAGTAGCNADESFWKSVRAQMSRPKSLSWW
jgi:hypothetical protein